MFDECHTRAVLQHHPRHALAELVCPAKECGVRPQAVYLVQVLSLDK